MPKLIRRTKCIMGVFDDDTVFLEAVKSMRSHGLNIKNAFTPFPVHGLDKAIGLRDSRLGYVAFAFGALGTISALSLMTFTMHISWPLNIGGKPSLPIPSFIPITFELTVLFASLGLVAMYLMRNSMIPGFEPKIYHSRSTQDRFVVLVEDNKLGSEIKDLMEKLGAVEVQDEEYLEQTSPVPLPIIMK